AGCLCPGSTLRRAIGAVQHLHHRARRPALDAVPDRLAVAAAGDDALAAQQRQMLRDRRIADAEELGELADGFLALDQLAQDQQPVLVGPRLRLLVGLVGGRANGVRIDVRLDIHSCVSTLLRIYSQCERRARTVWGFKPARSGRRASSRGSSTYMSASR